MYKPWEVIDAETTEPFALRFELDAMLRLGNSLQDVLFNYAWDGLTYTVMSRTMLGALYAGLWPLGLMKLVSVLDNPFSVALARADKAGKVLAHALIDGVQGKRPVTLMGYSVGARVIYACLLELAEQHAFGLVESVVLMGTPAPSDSNQWRQIRSVVSARVVNVYSTEDYVLGYLYRSAKLEFGVAGLDKVSNVYGIENMDMSKLVNGHDKYRYLAGKILVNIGFGDVNFDKVAEQERSLELAERKKQRAKEQSKKTEAEKASNANTQVSAKPSSPSLIDISEDPTPQQLRSTPTAEAPRPRPQQAMYTQSGSKQQPMRQKPLATVRPTPDLQRSSATPSASTLDPLGATEVVDTSEPTVRKATFPTASALPHRQIPSSQIADPAAQHQPVRVPPKVAKDSRAKETGTINMVDTTQVVVPTKASGDSLKTQPAVTVAEVVVVGREGSDATESEIDFCEDDSGSEMGELMMVEPVPMDDNDYGLM